ncbi:hypothetical protein ACWFR1_30830 [Streptomyces sp. NPDC055103]
MKRVWLLRDAEGRTAALSGRSYERQSTCRTAYQRFRALLAAEGQQAARVSDPCAFFLAEQGTPGVIVEHGPTETMFGSPWDPRTADYVNGRFR